MASSICQSPRKAATDLGEGLGSRSSRAVRTMGNAPSNTRRPGHGHRSLAVVRLVERQHVEPHSGPARHRHPLDLDRQVVPLVEEEPMLLDLDGELSPI